MVAGVLRVVGALGIALAMLAGIFGVMVLTAYAVRLILLRVPLTGKHRNKPLDLPQPSSLNPSGDGD